MPAWITITADNLEAYLVAAQLDALRTEALDDGQGDPFDEIMPDVVRKVRAYIASNPANQVDSTELTIPPELKTDVCVLIIAPMLSRLGIALTKDQAKQLDLAHSTLVALRDNKLAVSKPINPITPEVQSDTGAQLASPGQRQVTRADLNCL